MNDPSMINVWLAVLAIVSVLEFLMIVTAGVMGYRMYRTVTATLATVERMHLAPLHARADAILDEVHGVIDRVQHAQQSVGRAVRTANEAGQFIATAVSSRTRPFITVLKAAQILRQNWRDNHPREPVRIQSGL
jgi:hypothetical protein